MCITDRERKRYLKNINDLLICSSKKRKQFLHDFNSNIDDFLQNNPDASLDDLKNAMGTPQEIADGFMENISSKDIKKRLSIKKLLLIAVIFIVSAIVVFFVSAYIDVYKNNRPSEKITTVTYVEENGTTQVINEKSEYTNTQR